MWKERVEIYVCPVSEARRHWTYFKETTAYSKKKIVSKILVIKKLHKNMTKV